MKSEDQKQINRFIVGLMVTTLALATMLLVQSIKYIELEKKLANAALTCEAK